MISAQEVIERVNSSSRQFSKSTFNKYRRHNLIPEKKSAGTDDGKLVYLYPERTVEIINKVIDEREMGANLDYIATFLWLDVAFAELPAEELEIIKDYLSDYTLKAPDERGRVLSALTAGLEFIKELRKAHIPEEKLERLFWDMWQGIKLLVRYHQGKISEEEFQEEFGKPKRELDKETKAFAERLFAFWRRQEEEIRNASEHGTTEQAA